MKLFDLHCDTATRLLGESQHLKSNNLHISLERAEIFEQYAQVMAIWTNYKLGDDEGYFKFFEVLENLDKEIAANEYSVSRIASSIQLEDAISSNKIPLILAVEDARILNNDLSRLDVLYDNGVRFLTLNWYGETCIGGAHDTSIGLTDFGISVVKKCFELGIVPDISHCSFRGAKDTIELALTYNKPIVATHSDSYFVNPHTRNLKDEAFIEISKLFGLVGINLCPSHLSSNQRSNINDVIKHIEHYLSIGGENTLAMGCDLDGTDLPEGFSGVNDICKIINELQRLNYSDDLIEKITYKNAFEFFKRSF